MAITKESKAALKNRIFAINKSIDEIDLEIDSTVKAKAPYEEKLDRLRAQKADLQAQKQAIQGDIA